MTSHFEAKVTKFEEELELLCINIETSQVVYSPYSEIIRQERSNMI